MAEKFTIEDVINFANEMTKKGYYNKGTNANRISALNALCAVLSAEEKEPQNISDNLDTITKRWATATTAAPTNIGPTKSNVKKLLEDFFQYKSDPASLKPKGLRTKKEKTTKSPKEDEIKVEGNENSTEERKGNAPQNPFNKQYPPITIKIDLTIPETSNSDVYEKFFKAMYEYLIKPWENDNA